MADLVVSNGNAAALQAAINAAQPGDNVLVQNGTYVTTNDTGTDARFDGGFTFARSGEEGAPITLKNYPGHTPTIANAALGTTSYVHRPTLTSQNFEYLIVEGLRVFGSINFLATGWSVSGTTISGAPRGNVIRDNRVYQGWEDIDEGNWAAIRIEGQDAPLVRNNFVHDVAVLAGGGEQSSGAGIKIYSCPGTICELNTILHVNIPESHAGGIDDKADCINNTHRYNWIEDVNTGIRIQNQRSSGAAALAQGTRITQNIIILGNRGDGYDPPCGFRILILGSDLEISNNVVYCAAGSLVSGVGGATYADSGDRDAPGDHLDMFTGVRYINNIHALATAAFNHEMYGSAFSAGGLCAYNRNHSSKAYKHGNTNYSFANWQSVAGLDVGMSEGDPLFVTPGSNFRLQAGSSCVGAGRVGGVSGGAAIDQGAYVNGIDQIDDSISSWSDDVRAFPEDLAHVVVERR